MAPLPPASQASQRALSFNNQRRIGSASSHDISVVSGFNDGYRNREDVTLLKPGTMIVGSQNVLTNTSERVGSRAGYVLDGPASMVVAPILSCFDWNTHVGNTHHLRAGFLTSAGNDGKLQFRYDDGLGTANSVQWIDLLTGLTSSYFNFTDYWDNTNLQSLLLMVNRTPNIYEWSGGLALLASATATTVTLQGGMTWAQLGFYNAGTRSITINGVSATYTGGESTSSLTGVSVDFSARPAGSIIFQTVRVTANSSMVGLPTQANALIANLRNQIYVGCLTSNNVYVSKVNNYQDYSYATPRAVGDGALLTLDGAAAALIPQEDYMTLFAGKDQAYQTQFTLSADLVKESFQVTRLKTTARQGARSQGLTTKIKNDVVFVSYETIINTLGRVNNVVLTPQITDLSYSIVNDINTYDFTDGSVFYEKQFVYVCIPKQSIVRIYNMTNEKHQYWEAPQTMPISCISNVDGQLIGHSYQTSQSYQLFVGLNDNGQPINAIAQFAFENSGIRAKTKSFNKFWIEGYISNPTTITAGIQYDFDGCATNTSYPINGTDSTVCNISSDNSLGKYPLGEAPLGGNPSFTSPGALPPRFNVIKTFVRVPYFNWSPSFSSYGLNQQWELLGFGTNASATSEGENDITQ